MPFGSQVRPGLDHGGASLQQVASGSVKSDYGTANTSLQTVNTNALLNIGTSTSYTTVQPVKVPVGATRCYIRASVSTDATTFTTQPIVKLVGTTPESETPVRIDAPTDSDGAGQTLTLHDSDPALFQHDSRYWSEESGEFDCRAVDIVYMLVDTAASVTDGSTQQTVTGHIRFAN